MNSKVVIVSISLGGETRRVGKLWFHLRGARESASFEYDPTWLAHPERFALDPTMQLTEGTFHTGNDIGVFGAIGDSAPDRWGRALMRRANTTSTTFFEIDYLLGVNDEARQGALRFSLAKDKMSIPPLVYLPKLLSATERFIEDDESADLMTPLHP